MSIPTMITELQRLTPEILSSCCIVNGQIMSLDEVQKMGYNEFSLRSKINMPLRLYRYYPNQETKDKEGNTVNYSIEALKNNTVYLQSPANFDDVYDSDIHVDFRDFERLRLIEYCRRCGIETYNDQSTQDIGSILVRFLFEHYCTHGDLENVFVIPPSTEIEKLANCLIGRKILTDYNQSHDFGKSVRIAIHEEYASFIKDLKNMFRTTCFATTPYSQLMWGGSYAHHHEGFCVEYTIEPENQKFKDLYYNLFPIIYCKTRPNMTERLVSIKDENPTKESLWDIYFHGALRKSIDWAFQNEWRLLLPRQSSEADYNIKFYPISKVFLGNRMKKEERSQIIEICHDLNIPYIGVKRNPNLFEMQECEIKCEDCPQFRE